MDIFVKSPDRRKVSRRVRRRDWGDRSDGGNHAETDGAAIGHHASGRLAGSATIDWIGGHDWLRTGIGCSSPANPAEHRKCCENAE